MFRSSSHQLVGSRINAIATSDSHTHRPTSGSNACGQKRYHDGIDKTSLRRKPRPRFATLIYTIYNMTNGDKQAANFLEHIIKQHSSNDFTSSSSTTKRKACTCLIATQTRNPRDREM
ncbi:hypothetical protein DPMN_051064 [Dreissena polymorpha]|uniref:Uncharacterized protein n=1 Tax=Dreissena polymorpha TaxID=45954 RepID=A0A9D4HMY2_DREPO|nr:hypothetical protein DPMN_051064 [Dreissena polymorpha]